MTDDETVKTTFKRFKMHRDIETFSNCVLIFGIFVHPYVNNVKHYPYKTLLSKGVESRGGPRGWRSKRGPRGLKMNV